MRHPSEPAFPSEQSETQDGTWNQNYYPGMTIRDYFAAQALIGLLARSPGVACENVQLAYEYAELMLKARES